ALRDRDARSCRGRGGSDPRRDGLYARAVDRARVPRRPHHPHLRGDERDPARRHRWRAPGGQLRPVTPGGHPLITALWLLGVIAAVLAFLAAILGNGGIAAVLSTVALIAFVAGSVAFQQRLRRFSATLVEVEEALDADDVRRARELMAPLLARFHTFPMVQ